MPQGNFTSTQSIEMGNAEPLKFLLEFEGFKKDIYYHLTGFRQVEVPDGQPQYLADGTVIQNYKMDEMKDPNVEAICNRAGGKWVVNGIDDYLNKHSAMADLNRDEIAELAGDCIKTTYDPLLGHGRTKYGVKSLSLIQSNGANNFNRVYAYLTALKEGGLRHDLIQSTQSQYGIQGNQVPQQEEQKRGILNLGRNNNR
jgi:hypothetical protein